MQLPGKWIEDLRPQTALAAAVARILGVRIGAVGTLLNDAARRKRCSVKLVHNVRVACRRLEAALRLFDPWIGAGDEEATRKLRRRVRGIRRAAGAVRDDDIHA